MGLPSGKLLCPTGKTLFSFFVLLTSITWTKVCCGFQPMLTSKRPLNQMQTHEIKIRSDSRLFSSAQGDSKPENDGRIDVSVDSRLYRTRLSRAPGIEWGTDLSFSFVYVRAMESSGEASLMGMVNIGDQLCEMIPVVYDNDAPRPEPVNLLGASFDFVMTSFASMDFSISEMDLVFFRGTKEELKALCNGEAAKTDADDTVTITVIQNKGSPEEKLIRLRAPAGVNVRQYLVDNGINVYQSLTRWTNCKGKQLCGTCIVNVADGLPNTNWKSMDEASTLRSNPDSYRLSCVMFAHGDVTVETFPPVNADQW
eukprot:CAMPEP_0197186536 /NCGR_PEP_ID=MMETSP1423-20130617/14123_1 /TAXON_ID=476441 /ORGANISM="Pseudo-nitzschia heimii, Strain UNC1101" /LENGTH=311 /DNA_ID=CAMNT_0042637885 /DNA_START=34 /DNA_END=966 /DNA_ORIENTATION=-